TEGRGVLRAVDGAAGDQGRGEREEGVTDPRHGQVRHQLVALVERLHGEEGARGPDEGPVREEGALGDAGGAGRVVDEGDVLAPPRGELLLEGAAGRPPRLSSALLHRREGEEPRLGVAPHALGVVVYDVPDLRQPRALLEALLDLLLVL